MYKNQSMSKTIALPSQINIFLAIATLVFMFGILFPIQAKADTSIPLCEITRSLKVGSSGEDVKCLQRYLNFAGFTVSTEGMGSPGNESMYYGQKTAEAVKKWQDSNSAQVLTPLGLNSGTGNWGQSSFNRYVSIVRVALGLPA